MPTLDQRGESYSVRVNELPGRPRINLGKVKAAHAKDFLRGVEDLISLQRTNARPTGWSAEWLATMSPDLRMKLAAAGLGGAYIPPPSLGVFCDQFIEQSRRTGCTTSTMKKYEAAAALLKAGIGENVRIDQVTVAMADTWRAWLIERGPETLRTTGRCRRKLQPWSKATLNSHARHAKTIFNSAVKLEIISISPLRNLDGSNVAAKHERYVTAEESEAIIDACPNAQWRLYFGLSRFAGLRVPGEADALTWGDVDFDKARMTVRCIKTERIPGHEQRIVPIVPRLMELLVDAQVQAADGEDRVITLPPGNRHGRFKSILKRAGVKPWKKQTHLLRSNRQTDWTEEFPEHVASEWIGNSVAVGRKHYLMVTNDALDRAAGKPGHKLGQTVSEGDRTDAQTNEHSTGQDDLQVDDNAVTCGAESDLAAAAQSALGSDTTSTWHEPPQHAKPRNEA